MHISILTAFIMMAGLFLAMCGKANARAEAGAETSGEEGVAASALQHSLQAQGFAPGAAVYLRIFKTTSEIEIWLARSGRFHLFATHKICRWSGGIGPKLEEGDRQSPEGVYAISSNMRINRRWHRAMGLNFPNAYDQSAGRTGSGILIHGKCSSTGCFALTDPIVEEVYELVDAALAAGQPSVPVHIFPFRMTAANMKAHEGHEWFSFWQSLQPGYTMFERDRLPPRAILCGEDYWFQSPRIWRSREKFKPASGCEPLTAQTQASAAPRTRLAAASAAPAMTPQERARSCDPRQVSCRMLRYALTSKAACPRKYARCRNAQTAAIKSVDCPLKYPRCRRRGGARTVEASARRR